MDNSSGSTRDEERMAAHPAGRSPYLLWLVWLVWLPLIIPTLVKFLQSHPDPLHLIGTLTVAAAFFALYIWSGWLRSRQFVSSAPPASSLRITVWPAIVALTLLSAALTLWDGNGWQALFFYTAGYAGGCLPIRRIIPVAALLILLALLTSWIAGLGWFDLAQIAVFIPAIVCIIKCVMWSITTSWELQAAREEIARLAVTSERLRIARDLHDLLGHNLSLITLKSELAGRLLNKAPERAAREISDIEQVARTTLQEVREAVSSYRQPTLSSELRSAREILAAAGIAYSLEGEERGLDTLPTPVEAVLAWSIREGVTNVIRHSRARQCTIALQKERREISVQIRNDGARSQASPATSAQERPQTTAGGNGLRGLAERVAALGGQCTAAPYGEDGFSLNVSLPLTQRARPSSSVPAAPACVGSPLMANYADSSQERSV